MPWIEIISTALVLLAIWIKHQLDIIRERKSLEREWALERLKRAYDKKLEALEKIRDQLPAIRSAVFGPLNEMGAIFNEDRRVFYDEAMVGVYNFERFLLSMKPYLSSGLQATSSNLVNVIHKGRMQCQSAGSQPGKRIEGRYEQWSEGYELLTKDAWLIVDRLDEECIVEIGKMIETGQ